MDESLFPKLTFKYPFGDREAYEAEARGYLGYAVVELEDSSKIPVVFYDPIRLQQDLLEEAALGNPFIAEPGMIVIESITIANMEYAIKKLFMQGFFESFRKFV